MDSPLKSQATENFWRERAEKEHNVTENEGNTEQEQHQLKKEVGRK